MIRTYPAKYLNHLTQGNRLFIGAFDLDGNILNTPTPVHVINLLTGEDEFISGHRVDQHPELTRGPHAQYRFHPEGETAFCAYRDFSEHHEHRGADGLIQDIDQAIESEGFAPSFEALRDKFLVPARVFSIITARGHSMENLSRAMRRINDVVLTPEQKEQQYEYIRRLAEVLRVPDIDNQKRAINYYTNEIVGYYAVSSPNQSRQLWIDHRLPSAVKKTKAMVHMIQGIRTRLLPYIRPYAEFNGVSIGFSDDSYPNINVMQELFLSGRAHDIVEEGDKVRIFYTGHQDDQIDRHPSVNYERKSDALILRIPSFQ